MKGLLAGAIAIVILALVIPRPDDPAPPEESAEAARASAISIRGSFSHNSRDGMPTFTASNVGPGTLVEGAVTIANIGGASGYFALSQKDLTDVLGPNGGALSRKLRLEIRDVTTPSKPVGVYTGPFADIGVRMLGFIAADSDRDYQFTATIPDTGGPGSPIGGDNALKGSSARARFVWSAVEGAPPARPDKPAPPKDRRPPRLGVSIPRVQPLVTRRYLETKVRCSEACALTVTGRTEPTRARSRCAALYTTRCAPRANRATARRAVAAGPCGRSAAACWPAGRWWCGSSSPPWTVRATGRRSTAPCG